MRILPSSLAPSDHIYDLSGDTTHPIMDEDDRMIGVLHTIYICFELSEEYTLNMAPYGRDRPLMHTDDYDCRR